MPLRRKLLTFVLAGSFAIFAFHRSAAVAAPGIVITTTGQTYEGEITESPSSIQVSIHGVSTTIPRSDIATIDYAQGSFRDRFAERYKRLKPTDVNGRLALARFAMQNSDYETAATVTDEALTIEPNNNDAIAIRETIRRQVQADRNRAATTRPVGGPASSVATVAATSPANQKTQLNADDIQKIRLGELKANDTARVIIPTEVRRTFARAAGMGLNDFNSEPTIQQATQIIQGGDARLIAQIRVASDPAAIVEYKRLQTLIVTGCAASNCHGGSNAGDFGLLTGDSDPVTYTNFYILTQYAQRHPTSNDSGGGFFATGVEHRMIERGRSGQSLLTEYGLPASKTSLRHPKVNGYVGIFRDADDGKYKKLADWIDSVLKPIDPEYRIDFAVPGSANDSPTTMPATQPMFGQPDAPTTRSPSGTKTRAAK